MLPSITSHINLENIGQRFNSNDTSVELFNHLNLSLCQGHSYAITGPSGSGKSSLLMLMSGLEMPSEGRCSYSADGSKVALAKVRDKIGFIFQHFHLLPELTALNNVALPLKLRGERVAEKKAAMWLEKVGLGHRLNHTPSKLSGGEQQRVAIARALVFEPQFIFADEPTGNLDEQNASDIADILFDCCKENGAGLVLVTHSQDLAHRADFVYRLKQGTCSLLASPQMMHTETGRSSETSQARKKVLSC